MKNSRIVPLLCVAALLCVTGLQAQQAGFTNPILPSGADPYSFFKDGFYYYTNSTGGTVEVWKTPNLADMAHAIHKVIYKPSAGTLYSRDLWAPEMMQLQGKWYAYFAADDGINEHHRIYALENASPDPMQGEWTLKGKVADASDKWAIDADVFTYNGKLYMLWSGWESDTNGRQNIYIAAMKNPWTIDGQRTRISMPQYSWERNGDLHDARNPPHVDVNEGPQALQHNGNLFVVYSASGCWTDFYALGLLQYNGKGDILDSSAWTKSTEPVFQQLPASGVYAPGHNSFFMSPDGKENWILYHANSHPGEGCGNRRSPRMQSFSWNADGTPHFGEPVKTGESLALPSGTGR